MLFSVYSYLPDPYVTFVTISIRPYLFSLLSDY